MEYSNKITFEHPLSNTYSKDINILVKTDGGQGRFIPNTMVISLDDAEKGVGKSNRSKTMDIALGVINRGTSKNPKNKRILLCEFRFNYKNPKNISATEIKDKIDYSKKLVRKDYDGVIDSNMYFLFNVNIDAQARSIINRKMSGRVKNIIITTERGFKELINR